MSANKLEQITRELFEQGLEKGEAEGKKKLEEALLQAERLIAEAEDKAKEMIRLAQEEALKQENKIRNEFHGQLDLLMEQMKQRVSESLSHEALQSSGLDLSANALWKDCLEAVFRSFAQSDRALNNLTLALPADWESRITNALKPAMTDCLSKGLTIDPQANSPFSIKIKGKNPEYEISLEPEEIKLFIIQRLSQQTRKLLFS
jgi:V/A-type H+-transporting ATPase subunit E